jgi:hypothetical protein
MKVGGYIWLGLVWLDWQLDGRIFFMPRSVRNLSENGKEILSMKVSGLVWWDWQLEEILSILKVSGLAWLGLVWWDWQLDGRIFFMPRFVTNLSENGKEILSMKVGGYTVFG